MQAAYTHTWRERLAEVYENISQHTPDSFFHRICNHKRIPGPAFIGCAWMFLSKFFPLTKYFVVNSISTALSLFLLTKVAVVTTFTTAISVKIHIRA